jgi:hypothetical protein
MIQTMTDREAVAEKMIELEVSVTGMTGLLAPEAVLELNRIPLGRAVRLP